VNQIFTSLPAFQTYAHNHPRRISLFVQFFLHDRHSVLGALCFWGIVLRGHSTCQCAYWPFAESLLLKVVLQVQTLLHRQHQLTTRRFVFECEQELCKISDDDPVFALDFPAGAPMRGNGWDLRRCPPLGFGMLAPGVPSPVDARKSSKTSAQLLQLPFTCPSYAQSGDHGFL
jgi:hypothetical protein